MAVTSDGSRESTYFPITFMMQCILAYIQTNFYLTIVIFYLWSAIFTLCFTVYAVDSTCGETVSRRFVVGEACKTPCCVVHNTHRLCINLLLIGDCYFQRPQEMRNCTPYSNLKATNCTGLEVLFMEVK